MRIAFKSLTDAICRHIKRKMGTITSTTVCATNKVTDTRSSIRLRERLLQAKVRVC